MQPIEQKAALVENCSGDLEAKPKDIGQGLNPLQVVVLLLSIYVLLALLVQSVFHLGPEASAFLDRIDFGVCVVFLIDFFVRLTKAKSKSNFLKWGWIDFISSIPMLDIFRFGRVIRVVRVFRLLRAFRSANNLIRYMLKSRKTSSFAGVVVVSFILMVFSSIAMLQFETMPDSNIRTPMDAFWWAITTMTTVGYGDRFPVTNEGRMVACVLMVAGVGLFGSFTGFMASLLVEPEIKEEESEIRQLAREVRRLSDHIQILQDTVTKKCEDQNPVSGN